MTYARRTDSNHRDIVDALRRVPGIHVQDVSSCPSLGFDLIVRYQDRAPMLMEVKATPRSALTVSEKAARKFYSPYWARVETFEQALEALGISAEPAPETW